MAEAPGRDDIGWVGIARLGLVQAALGAVVVIATTTLNRVMAVELALPALVPGALIATHHAAQLLRPGWGHRSDRSGRRTPVILGGMALLALGGFGATLATAAMSVALLPALAAAALSYLAVGAGAGAAGTSLLALAATRVAPSRRAAAASAIWITMIVGFAVTAGLAGAALDPFSFGTLVRVSAVVSSAAVLVSAAALLGLEGKRAAPSVPAVRTPFGDALREVWAEPAARRFACFVFLSMLAYGAEELVLDPFAGRVLGLSPGETTRLSGLQHGGAFAGMVLVAAIGAMGGRRLPGLPRACTVAGCVIAAAMLGLLALSGAFGAVWPLRAIVACLGFGNGVFAVAAVGAMMGLAGAGASAREGVRMGLWGAAQALAFALGSLGGPALVDLMGMVSPSPGVAYGTVFLVEAGLFLFAARGAWVGAPATGRAGAAPVLAVSA